MITYYLRDRKITALHLPSRKKSTVLTQHVDVLDMQRSNLIFSENMQSQRHRSNMREGAQLTTPASGAESAVERTRNSLKVDDKLRAISVFPEVATSPSTVFESSRPPPEVSDELSIFEVKEDTVEDIEDDLCDRRENMAVH